MVQEEDVVNREQKRLMAEEKGPQVGEVHQICSAGDDGKIDLLVADAGQAKRRPIGRQDISELPMFGSLEPPTDHD